RAANALYYHPDALWWLHRGWLFWFSVSNVDQGSHPSGKSGKPVDLAAYPTLRYDLVLLLPEMATGAPVKSVESIDFMKIEIEHLNKIYRGDVHALENVNLSISGGMYGLLGPNGAGKTTLMRILAGILRPSGGKLSIGGYDYETERGRVEVKRLLGYLPQEMGVYPDLNARE